MSDARISSPATARPFSPGPRSHSACCVAMSERKPGVDALARLFAVVVWRDIALRIAESAL